MTDLLPPLTAEDLYAFRFASDPRISPDGEVIAFVVKVIDRDANDYRSHIWVVPFDGSRPAEQFTFGPKQDASPRWSPDGRWLAFTSDRLGIPAGSDRKKAPREIFVMPARGGEARALTRVGEDCGDIAWTPRGDGIVFGAKDARPAGWSDDGIRVYDRLRYRSDEAGMWDGRHRHLWLASLDGTPPRRLTDGDWDDAQPAVSPDGARVAFVSDRTDDRHRNTVADIWTVALDGTDPRRLTDGRGAYGVPAWSPDGATVVAQGLAVATGSNSSENARLWSFPATATDATGTDLLAGWDRTVGSAVGSDMRARSAPLAASWDAARERIRFIGSDGGTANVYSCAATGGDVRPETSGAHHLVEASFDATGRRYAANVATAIDPGNITAGETRGAMRRVTDVNGELLSRRQLHEPEDVTFEGADGWTIHGWLIKPRGWSDASRKWPLVLEVHGGPHAAYGRSFFHEFQVLAGRGYAVLYTNPRGSHAQGDAFVGAVVGDWGGKDYEDLMRGVDHALGWGWVDERRLYLTGGSYGGFMTNWIVGHTDRFRAAATQRCVSDNVSAFGTSDIGWHFWQQEMGDATPWRDREKLVERSPLTYVENIRTPLLLLHAERDLRCPIGQAEEMFAALQVLGRESVLVRFPDDNHDLTRSGKPRNRVEHCRRIADWFDAHP